MQISSLRLPLASMLLAAAAVPAFAGNYAEGDPRPVAQTSNVSSPAVAAETRAWMAAAPTLGYPEGNPQAVVQVQQKTRAAVQADTMNWIRSGLGALSYSDAYASGNHPAYAKASRAYAQLRGSGDAASASLTPVDGNAVTR